MVGCNVFTRVCGGWPMNAYTLHTHVKHANFNCKWLTELGGQVGGSVGGDDSTDHKSLNRIELYQYVSV